MRLKRRLTGFYAFSKNGISAAILLAAGLAAGCSSDFSRFTEGISKSSAAKNSAQPQYAGSYPPAPVNSSAYHTKVESSELAPPPAAVPAAASPAVSSAAPQRSQSQGQMPAEDRRQTAAADKEKKHKISYKVVSGDTLLGLGRRYDTSAEDIKRDNQLSSDKILIGQKLTIYTSRKEEQSSAAAAVKKAPAKAESKAAVPVPTMDPEDSAAANNASSDGAKAAPAAGAANAANEAAADKTAETAPAANAAVAGQADKSGNAAAAGAATTAASAAPQNAAKPAAAAQTQAAPAQLPAPAADSAPMIWPVKGNIISAYGQRTGTTTNDGIDIAVPEGTSVKAAAAGTVIYAGDGLKEFGNTILIRHEDNVVTVYGHNSKLLVHRGQQVQKGEEIAQSGSSGNAAVAKLHFEVRKNSAPVNPMKYLPLTH